jgi:hypothetical protein
MKRDSVQTVTLPVLVKADNAKEADGWGTFLPAEFEETWFILKTAVTLPTGHRFRATSGVGGG